MVKPYQETTTFWYNIWKSNGKTRTGVVFNIMKKTRNQYHLMIRRVKRLGSYIHISNCKLLDNAAKNEDIFNSIRNSRKEKGAKNVAVENVTGKKVGDLFAEKYEKLFNSAEDSSEIDDVREKIEMEIMENEDDILNIVNKSTVIEAIGKLKNEKSDP